MTLEGTAGEQRVTIILHSGAYDRASFALALALAALATGREVHMLVTYEGLRRFTKGHLADLGEETSPAVRASIKRGLETGGIQTLQNRVADAKTLGLKLYACPSAMAILNIAQDELLPEIDCILGLVSFVEIASGAEINWYI